MAKRILMPIVDGEAAEAIGPIVAALARDSGATVRLVRVEPVPEHVIGTHGRVVAYVDQEMDRLTRRGLDELAAVEARIAGAPVERAVRFGEVASEIALEAEAFGADLIALTDERRGRLARAIAPTLADEVTSRSDVPVLALRG
ncbi:MAG: universal stress protein [Candidatus Rokubacteria bacterium]|nr:universal stress protein [Candidatus Rokubacteria bacterium]MBI3826377.1 universal stress protein [Candidatus Rokubacteria bacterium]